MHGIILKSFLMIKVLMYLKLALGRKIYFIALIIFRMFFGNLCFPMFAST